MLRKLWGDLHGEELKKYLLLAVTFLFLIGVYWLLRSVKDSILASTVGIKYQPMAKIVSLFTLVPLILCYSKLIDMFPKHKLFYIIGGMYLVIFILIAYGLTLPGVGLSNTIEDPSRLIGWITYISIESFGSLLVALFWSFVASSTNPESAKKGYPLIIFGAQFGSITGPVMVSNAQIFGVPGLVFIACGGIGMVIVMVYIFLKVLPPSLTGTDSQTVAKEGTKKTGIFEGVKLLFSHKYLAGIFCVATFYEIVGTILDFQMKLLARQVYSTPETFASFMGNFGIGCNTLTLAFSLVGTSFIMKRFGLTFCLVLFPITVGAVVLYVYFNASIWVLFGGMMVIRCFTYAVNNPAKEIMYIPTSKDIKFKTKGWIDMFGARSAKATGSLVNNTFKESANNLLTYGTFISLGIVCVWIFVAAFVGRTFEKLTKENKTIS